MFWRDLHGVTGFWISGLALFLLFSGLPWAKFWGDYFRNVTALTGTAVARQDWTNGQRSTAGIASRWPRRVSTGPFAARRGAGDVVAGRPRVTYRGRPDCRDGPSARLTAARGHRTPGEWSRLDREVNDAESSQACRPGGGWQAARSKIAKISRTVTGSTGSSEPASPPRRATFRLAQPAPGALDGHGLVF